MRDSAVHEQRRRQNDLRRALTVAKWTDNRFLDPLVGFLLPGVGDVLGAVAGMYIVVVAVRHRVPRAVVARMLVNLSIDCVGGVVPVVGDLFDALNRANLRNVRLLERHLTARPHNPERAQSLGLAVAMLLGAVAVALAVAYIGARYWRRR